MDRPWPFAIDPTSPVPPYEQLRTQVLDGVRAGTFPPGAQLPTVRRLAEELGIAPNTVARSYRELERDEVIETRGRNGSFIAATGDATHRQAQAAASAFAERVRQLRLPEDEAIELVRRALAHSPHRNGE
jgi:DNA-binding transcriptional regulator YhcF (GntR family)